MLKLCFSTLGCTDRPLDDILSLAKNFDIHALEVRGVGGELDNVQIADFSAENAAETVSKFEKAGVKPLVLGTSVSFHDPKNYDRALKEGRSAIDIAARIGFRAIRVFGDSIIGDESDCVDRVGRGVRSLCCYAEKLGVDVLLEVHGDFNTEARLAPIVQMCRGFSCFGLIWDICHTRDTYPDWHAFYRIFAPYIRHVHMKDILDGHHVLPGEGVLPIAEITEELIEFGYNGYFSLEWEKKWHPELPPIEQALSCYCSMLLKHDKQG